MQGLFPRIRDRQYEVKDNKMKNEWGAVNCEVEPGMYTPLCVKEKTNEDKHRGQEQAQSACRTHVNLKMHSNVR